MKTRISLVLVIFSLLWVQIALSAQSMGKQWEDRQNWSKAAESYSAEASVASDLNRKAELLADVARCYLKDGNITGASWTINSIREYSANRGATLLPPLMTQFETAGWQVASQGDFQSAFQALTIVLQQSPGKRQAFAEKAYAKGYKDLAYQLNSNLKEFDCKAMRTKALTATTTQDMAQQLSATKGMCTSAPTAEEHQAFSAKAMAENDDLVALSLYEQIKGIWGYIDQTSTDRVIDFGRKIRVIEGREADVERIRQLLPAEVIEKRLARQSTPGIGEYLILETKGGERSPRWIAPSVVGRVAFAGDCAFTIVTDDGQRYDTTKKADNERFRYSSSSTRFYVVAAPADQQPPNMVDGLCRVYIIVK